MCVKELPDFAKITHEYGWIWVSIIFTESEEFRHDIMQLGKQLSTYW
jgi:hypothetical protein